MSALRIAFAALVLCAAPAAAESTARINASAARDLNHMCRSDGGHLWGERLCGPLLVVDPQTRAVWASQADAQGVLHQGDGGWVGVLPAGVGVANTSVEWAGVRWIMVMGPLPSSHTERRVLVAHEAWHHAQDAIGLAAQGSDCAHLESEQGRTLLRLEMRALARALRSGGGAREQAMREALAFRAARLATFPDARAQETALDRNEGLASYTGVALGAQHPEDYAAKTLDSYDHHAAYARAYAYATGPAYGLLLDDEQHGWRRHLGADAPADLLAVALRVQQPSAADLARVALTYGSATIAAEESGRAGEQRTRIAALHARYAEGVRLVLPLSGQMRMEFDPNQVTPVEGLGNAYGTLTIHEAWGQLTATQGALISADYSSVIAAEPETSGLSGPGWTLALGPGYRLVGPDAHGVRTIQANSAAQ